ncbi:MAG: MFS transporter [Candidatus Binatia bacterium]
MPRILKDIFRPIRDIGADGLRLLAVLTGGHIVIHWFQQLLPVVLPSVKAGLGLNDIQVGALTSAKQLMQGTLNLPSGMLADSMVRHRGFILAMALVCMGVAYFLLGITSALSVALVGAGCVGLGSSLWHPAAVASLSNRFPARRATALAVHGTGATVSDTVTPLVVGGLLMTFPWEKVLKFQLVPALFFGLVVWWGLAGLYADSDTHSKRSGQIREIADLARNPVFFGVSVARGLMQMGRLVILTFLPIYLQEDLGYSPFVLGFHLALLHALGTVSQPLMGYLSDRFGRKAVLVPSFFTLGILYILLVVAAPGIQLALVIGAIGLFFYTLMNISNVAIMDVAGSKIQGSSYGLTSLVTQLIVIPTPMVTGFLIEAYGIAAAFLLSGIFALLAGVAVAPLRLYQGDKG